MSALVFDDPQVILKEREERKQRRLLEEKAPTPPHDSAVAAHADEDESCDAELTGQGPSVGHTLPVWVPPLSFFVPSTAP